MDKKLSYLYCNNSQTILKYSLLIVSLWRDFQQQYFAMTVVFLTSSFPRTQRGGGRVQFFLQIRDNDLSNMTYTCRQLPVGTGSLAGEKRCLFQMGETKVG